MHTCACGDRRVFGAALDHDDQHTSKGCRRSTLRDTCTHTHTHQHTHTPPHVTHTHTHHHTSRTPPYITHTHKIMNTHTHTHTQPNKCLPNRVLIIITLIKQI